MKRKILITMGDFNGVGPEVTLKALQDKTLFGTLTPVLLGSRPILDFYAKRLKLENLLPKFEVIECAGEKELRIQPGQISEQAGKMSALFLKKAIELANRCESCAIVTAPISKEALWMAGYRQYPGQTEFLAQGFGVGRFAMVLLSGRFRVGFVTTHQPIREVASKISIDIIIDKVFAVVNDLKKYFGAAHPKLAMAALNPHAGEHGRLGTEEEKIIRPAVKQLIHKGIDIHGPFPADTLFTGIDQKNFDAYMVQYHDQGMIPIKMYGFGSAVNFTSGLPVPRTSPDHGTAFDIAGKGLANAQSMKEAIRLAVQLASKKY
ncbi:4-hydroxythreonine-4-phosphate dehydrogenase 2 [bacterium BMS3Abin05]|nr:4-hydroxythreonine-4-phosphate dehydrogenase 2 [bacterium BMS3Abin05]GBE28467.1 4-hydroxythreonine-4-phosphate dehydrogenase 2 [bacterium BMS3Bbin03]HDL79015.1 4-hydroxythreonine-4-phosphate dehydrogenase PdxA [Bacteroidota bacterium]HDZ12509.1 4-hydroxythreonine-4-phosphate dehydrogenase PdxA [Bacteroidota bacterium]